jgi:tetratricopeptide (TPR) repeat protein
LDNLAKRDPIANYSKMIKANSQDYRAYNNRGNEYDRRGHHELAIADYNKAIELRPDFSLAFINRGNAYQKIGEFDKALSDYNRAIELNPHSDMAYNNRGFHLILMGDLDAAEKDISEALAISPNNIYALNSMAELFAMKNHPEESCGWLKRAIEKGYNNWNYIKTSKTYNNIRNSECFKEMIKEK